MFTKLRKFTAIAIALPLIFGGIQPSVAKAETTDKTFKVLSLNVAGLPALLSSGNPGENTVQISPKLNNYDLVSVQEDFAYHDELKSKVALPYLTETTGNVPFGDGMNFFSKLPLSDTNRYKWKDRHGFISDGADQMTPKGILCSSMQLENGHYVDVYDMHTDADTDVKSCEARRSNMNQLAELIKRRSPGRAVIVIGDTNSRYTRAEDNFEDAVLKECGLTDAWIELIRKGNVPADGEALIDKNNINSASNEVVDKIWYRSGSDVKLNAQFYALLDREFVNDKNEQLSDHYPVTATFKYSINDSVIMSNSFGGNGGGEFNFMDKAGSAFPDSIDIHSGNRVDAISFTYGNATASAGGDGGTSQSYKMKKGEYPVSMTVSKVEKNGSERISYIAFKTNLGNVISGGIKNSSQIMTFDAPSGYGIAGLYGFSADEIDKVGCVFTKCK